MSLSMRDVFALTQGGSGRSSITDASSTTGAGGGGMGGPPDMGGDPSRMPGSMTSASSDSSAAPVMDTSTPSTLFDAVIKLLQKKVAG